MGIFKQYLGLRKEVYVLVLGRIVTNMGAMIWPVMTLILNQKMGLNATQVALVTVISGIAILPSGIIGGKLADRFNKKTCIIICDLVSIVFYVICAFVPLSYTSILLLYIGSTFQNMEDPMYNALIADITTTKDREKGYSLMYLGGNIGLIASPTIAGLLFANHLWLSFLISGIGIAVSTLLIFLFVRNIVPVEEVSEESSYQENRDDISLWKLLMENKVILLYIIISGIYWAAYGQYGYLMPLDLGRVHGEQGAMLYGSVASLNCIVVVAFTPIFTKLFKRITQTWKNLLGEIILLLGYATFLCFLGTIPFYYVAMTLFTFGEILTTLANGPYLANRMPASHRGRINGATGFLHNLFYGVTMYITGVIYDEMGNVFAWGFIFLLLVTAIIASIFLIILDKKHYGKLY